MSVALVRALPLETMLDLADRFSKSGLVSRALQGKPADVLVTLLMGQELGLAPMAALRSIYVIEGKPSMSADLMVALALSSGLCEYFERVGETAESVTYATKRKGRTEQRCTWTLEQAKAAALRSKDNWRLYPRAMLASRAKAELARDVYPDVLTGVYTHEELARDVPAPAFEEAEFTEAVANENAPPCVDAINATTTLEALEALAPELASLTGAALATAQSCYRQQRALLRKRTEP